MMNDVPGPITGDHLKAWGHRPGPAFPALIERANAALTEGADHDAIRSLLAVDLAPPALDLHPSGAIPLEINIHAEDPD